jgi:hypothetical protein
MGIGVPPLTTTVMNVLGMRHAGIASGINNAVSRAAGLLAIALVSLLVLHVFDAEMNRHLAASRLPPEVQAALAAERGKLGGVEPPPTASPSERAAIRGRLGFVRQSLRWMVGRRGSRIASAGTAAP